MKTFFALHCITNRNIDDNYFDKQLKEQVGYDNETEYSLPDNQLPSHVDYAQGQIDEPLIPKGVKQAEFLGKQINDSVVHTYITHIYCADQKRCRETAEIIAQKIGLSPDKIIVDKRINARSYGIIAEQRMDINELKHPMENAKEMTLEKALKKALLIIDYFLCPERIGVENKKDFKARIKDFIHSTGEDLDNSLIVAGSDFWGVIKDENIFYRYDDEETNDLRRGQIADIDFEREKEQKTIKVKSKSRERTK